MTQIEHFRAQKDAFFKTHPQSPLPVGYFLRHLGEMILTMMVGMLVGGAILALMFSTVMASTIRGMTRVEVLNQFAVLICLVVAVAMIIAMLFRLDLYTRRKGHHVHAG